MGRSGFHCQITQITVTPCLIPKLCHRSIQSSVPPCHARAMDHPAPSTPDPRARLKQTGAISAWICGALRKIEPHIGTVFRCYGVTGKRNVISLKSPADCWSEIQHNSGRKRRVAKNRITAVGLHPLSAQSHLRAPFRRLRVDNGHCLWRAEASADRFNMLPRRGSVAFMNNPASTASIAPRETTFLSWALSLPVISNMPPCSAVSPPCYGLSGRIGYILLILGYNISNKWTRTGRKRKFLPVPSLLLPDNREARAGPDAMTEAGKPRETC